MATVLIVDDSLTVRMDLADAFDTAGFLPLPCATAADAREALARGSVDVVVLDVLLPDGDGLEILEEVRASPAGAQTVVLMLSTEAEVKDRIRGLRTGADEYVGKPYETGHVVTRARELLRARRANGMSGSPTILVVDDSLSFRQALGEALTAAGYAVLMAATGEDGLRVAADQRPTAIVVDGILPGIDGATVVRRIRTDAALRGVPCLLLTASEDREAELRALDAGADAFVRKDDDVDLVLAKLSAVLRRAAMAPAGVTASLLGPKRILAVDDSVTQLHELAAILRDDGYDVVLARSGEEALDLLAVQPVDCILLDLLMPGLGGQETCRRIKSAPPMRDIPLIMLTALEDRAAMLDGLGAGADDYIQKSSEVSVLKARVRAQLRRKQFEDENRRIREELLRTELEVAEARAARELAAARALHIQQLELKNDQLLREIGDRLNAEEQLRQAQKMEAIGRLTGGIAHDFNNLLTSVLGNLDLALNRTTDADVTRLLRVALKSAERGARLTSQLLAFGRRQNLRIRPIDLNGLIAGLEDVLASTVTSAVRIELSLDPALWPALADPAQIELALVNLTFNARDAMPGGGTLRIATRNVGERDPLRPEDLAPDAGTFVAFVASDTGTGMSAEVMARAFEPFFTTKEVGKGSGLGLSMVYGLAKQLGGTVGITSELGRGTEVAVYLPRAARAADPVVAPDSRLVAPPMTSGDVLLVDDDIDVLRLASAALRSVGYRVIEADNGSAALAIIDQGTNIDILVTDLVMPGMHGSALAAEARRRRPGLPVMLITGYPGVAVDSSISERGYRLLRKPFQPAELAAMVAEARLARADPSSKRSE